MNIKSLLTKAGVPEHLVSDAMGQLRLADSKSKGLFWKKWKVRLFESKKLAKKLSWESERLVDVDASLLDKDIEPMINITAYGDHVHWVEGVGPVAGTWMNQDPDSEDYKDALYWTARKGYLKGVHPRSDKFHAWWLRRNAGAGYAYRLGIPVSLAQGVEQWQGNDVTVLRCGDAWQVKAFKKLVGNFGLKIRIGYEIDNVFKNGIQQWYPVPGYELKAPLTWSILPGTK